MRLHSMPQLVSIVVAALAVALLTTTTIVNADANANVDHASGSGKVNAGFFAGYAVESVKITPTGLTGTLVLPAGSTGPYGNDSVRLNWLVEFQTQQRLHVKITDAAVARWEVPFVVDDPQSDHHPTQADDQHMSMKHKKSNGFVYRDYLDADGREKKANAPADHLTAAAGSSNGFDFEFSYTTSPFGFAVVRQSTGDVLFNSTPSTADQDFNGLTFENMYLEMSTRLPDQPNIYGLGERVHQFRLDPTGKTYTIFARDQGTPYDDGLAPGKNLYGSHPFYLEMRNGLAHGVFNLNSNAQDVVIDNNLLTYKIVGGVFDMYFVLGPEPESVVQQYHELIGKPTMIPYWGLGFHQCRWGYQNISVVEEVVRQYRVNQLPLDTMWNDIDYMDKYFDFTFDPVNFPTSQMQQFVANLTSTNQHYMMIVDAGIPIQSGYPAYDQGIAQNVFIGDPNVNAPALGSVWPGAVHFPDWLAANSSSWWVNNLRDFHTNSAAFSGVWLDMNEMSNFCDGDCNRTTTPSIVPPYWPGQTDIQVKTMSMDARHVGTTEFNAHSLFGFLETRATNQFLTQVLQRRPVIISRSTFPGHGRFGGHWLGDNTATWDDLTYSISGVFDFQLFGIPLVGADICGFNGDTTEELCTRWMQLGTLYPFSRNHNTIGARPQEPYAFGPTLLNASRIALNLRYSLLPYYYTIFHRMSIVGGSLFRPLMFEWPMDSTLLEIDHQFLIGAGLLASPVLTQGATSVSAYFPAAVWYDFYNGAPLGNANSGSWVTLDAPIDKIPLSIRGGHIIPMQNPNGALTTADTRTQPYQLLVALDANNTALGYLYWDEGDGVSTEALGHYTILEFQAQPTDSGAQLTSTLATPLYAPLVLSKFSSVTVYGVSSASTVAVNGSPSLTFSYNASSKTLVVSELSLSLGQPFTILWQ
ncbi:alpha-glucosidase [Capsaspora owczarzaki ATCC 30864]|nr:alpha-glucosidase [Capsaspora owczarzaki ATCC 30864]|eukprot:XP_004363327.2 alpha-glucosidase [Capsaspora owczarzaki ATCC 30864]